MAKPITLSCLRRHTFLLVQESMQRMTQGLRPLPPRLRQRQLPLAELAARIHHNAVVYGRFHRMCRRGRRPAHRMPNICYAVVTDIF